MSRPVGGLGGSGIGAIPLLAIQPFMGVLAVAHSGVTLIA